LEKKRKKGDTKTEKKGGGRKNEKPRERKKKKIEEKTRSWAGFGPAHAFGPGLAHFKKQLKKKNIFQYL
jgi:hypothetical protein